MKQIALPIKELQLLSNQIQNFQGGYTVEQIRLLDKVCQSMDKVLSPFSSKLKELSQKGKEDDNAEFDEFIEKEGGKVSPCAFEDADFEFLKAVWSKMSGLSGASIARKAIITIDDAMKTASDPTFLN